MYRNDAVISRAIANSENSALSLDKVDTTKTQRHKGLAALILSVYFR